jgi:hypothetical protein
MTTPMQEMLEWVRTTLPMELDWPMMIEQKIKSLLEKEKVVAQQYAAFAIECDRQKLPVVEFDDWINL